MEVDSMNISAMTHAIEANNSITISNYKNMQAIKDLSSPGKISDGKASNVAMFNQFLAQERGYGAAVGNIESAISMLQIAEGGASNIGDTLQRIRELSIRASSDIMTDDDRRACQVEVDQLLEHIEFIAGNTQYNTQRLLDGSYETNGLDIQIGPNAGQSMKIKLASLKGERLGIAPDENGEKKINLMDSSSASYAGKICDAAMKIVTESRARMGSAQNEFASTLDRIKISVENIQSSMSNLEEDYISYLIDMSIQNIIESSRQAMIVHRLQDRGVILKLLNAE